MNLTANFTLWELSKSDYAIRRGVTNEPTMLAKQNLLRLCVQVLEPVRALIGVPMHINSGYRSFVVNSAIGGSARSAHTEGLAADFVPVGISIEKAFDLIRKSNIEFDQLILECDAWIHISVARDGVASKKQVLRASGTPGNWTYRNVTKDNV